MLVEYDAAVLQNQAGYLVYDKSPGMTAKRNIERDLSKAMEHARVLGSTELDWQAYQRLKFDLKLIDRDANDDGARVDGGGEEIRGTIGFLFSAVLFLVLAVYGGVILRSVVEEKSNRVVEVLIAAVRPEELLLGKVIGMGAVASSPARVPRPAGCPTRPPPVVGLCTSDAVITTRGDGLSCKRGKTS